MKDFLEIIFMGSLLVVSPVVLWYLLKFFEWFENEYGDTTIYDHLPK